MIPRYLSIARIFRDVKANISRNGHYISVVFAQRLEEAASVSTVASCTVSITCSLARTAGKGVKRVLHTRQTPISKARRRVSSVGAIDVGKR